MKAATVNSIPTATFLRTCFYLIEICRCAKGTFPTRWKPKNRDVTCANSVNTRKSGYRVIPLILSVLLPAFPSQAKIDARSIVKVLGDVELAKLGQDRTDSKARQSVALSRDPKWSITLGVEDTFAECKYVGIQSLCEAHVPRDTRTVRVLIAASGYKKYSVNIPFLNFDHNGVAVVDIGKVKLTMTELPSVDQIILSHGKDQSFRFRITLHNQLQQEFLIRKVSIYARSDYDSGIVGCNRPSPHYFKLNGRLGIIGGGVSQKTITGTFEDVSLGTDYVIEMSGELKIDACSHYKLIMLHLPTSFILPKSEYTVVEVELPPQLVIGERLDPIVGHFVYRRNFMSNQQTQEKISISQFDIYWFHFLTSKEDELEIKGEFNQYK